MELIPDHGLATGRRWVMLQTWSKLLFAHWPLKAELLRALIPPALTVDTFDNTAWIGVVPFYMSNVRFRGMPSLPTTGEFCELNVRTYVQYQGVPGVWFFSLDAASRLAVYGARLAFHLPYYHAHMELKTEGEQVTYHSQRGAAAFSGRYQPVSPVFSSQPGTLEYWLTERYCLYANDRRGLIYRSDIQHLPWPLQMAEAALHTNTMTEAAGIQLPATKPLLHYAERVDVKAWYLKALP
jgi:hypothetical protein